MSEFDLIARLFLSLTEGAPGALGLKDDTALFTPPEGRDLVLTTDAIAEAIHYLADDLPEDVGARLLNVSLSDLAAKGARPEGYLISIAVPAPADEVWLSRFALGLMSAQTDHGTHLLGGDTIRTNGPRMFSLTAIGSVASGKMIRRGGAKPGDRLMVTGTIGDAALGLKIRKGELMIPNEAHRAYLVDRFTHIQPRLSFGLKLGDRPHASMDISDGLVADAGHMANASAVKLIFDAVRVPLSEAANAAVEQDPTLIENLLTGGDDYELLLAVSAQEVESLTEIAKACGHDLTEIGVIEEGQGVDVLDASGRSMQFRKGGYAHF